MYCAVAMVIICILLPETDANEQEDLGKALSAVNVCMHFIIAM